MKLLACACLLFVWYVFGLCLACVCEKGHDYLESSMDIAELCARSLMPNLDFDFKRYNGVSEGYIEVYDESTEFIVHSSYKPLSLESIR